jgi:O-antigen ligase
VAIAFGVLAARVPLLGILLGVGTLLACAPPAALLALMVASVTLQDAFSLPGGISPTQFAIVVAALAYGLRLVSQPWRRLAAPGMLVAWGVFLAVLLLAAAWAPYGSANGLKEAWRWSAAWLAWLIAANEIRRPWHMALVLAAVLVGPLANALLGLAQFWSGDGPPTFRIAPELRFVRASGSFGQPNSFAGYMNHAWPLALALATGVSVHAARRTGGRRVGVLALAAGLWGVTALLLGALGASFSRGAWLGAMCGLLAMVVAAGGWARRLGLALVLAALVALALGATSLLPAPISARLASITRAMAIFDPSTATVTPETFAAVERMAQIWAGWRMWLTYPVLGVGPGNFSLAYPDMAVTPWFVSRGHAHNEPLHMAAEAGLLGLSAYLALLGAAIRQALRALRMAQGMWWWVALGNCGIIAAVIGHSMFENLHVLHLTLHLAAVWGICASIAARSQPHTT